MRAERRIGVYRARRLRAAMARSLVGRGQAGPDFEPGAGFAPGFAPVFPSGTIMF
jgi:hypothetical protein